MECHFYFEVLAPKGLIGIEHELEKSQLGLSIYHSNFNNKNILTSDSDVIELGMDTSTTDVMYGSGFISSDFATAVSLMRKLSSVFMSANYNHKIGIDNEDGTDGVWITHNYS
jgi:hypothetical protein